MEKRYLINNIYVGKIEYEPLTLFYFKNGQYTKIDGLDSKLYNEYEIINLKEFIDYLEENNLDVLIKSEFCKNKSYLYEHEVLDIFNSSKNKEKLSVNEYKELISKSQLLSKIVSDLIGLNITDNPSTDLNIINREDVIVSAPKMLKFRSMIEKIIFCKLLNDEFELYNDDEISKEILCGLRYSNIKINNHINCNKFRLLINRNNFKELTGCIVKEKTKVYKIG